MSAVRAFNPADALIGLSLAGLLLPEAALSSPAAPSRLSRSPRR
jgi:hypothetical protein